MTQLKQTESPDSKSLNNNNDLKNKTEKIKTLHSILNVTRLKKANNEHNNMQTSNNKLLLHMFPTIAIK